LKSNRFDKKIAIFLIAFVFITTAVSAVFYFDRDLWNSVKAAFGQNQKSEEAIKVAETIKPAVETTDENSIPATTSTIKKEPPKHAASSKITGSTTTNSDGSKTTIVSDGGGDSSELSNIASLSPTGASPYDIRYSDETGVYPTLEKTLKDYLSSQLKWSDEISYMYQIIVRNAGDTGWEGQYQASYSTNANGDVVSAFGYIVLNVYYHKDSPQFNDYMKLVLSHEYGHHYTLYHKWIDLNLPAGIRFPDSYYTTRPLSKVTTATDYSLGWGNCEVEIIAEDYSYLYSGYGYHAMSGTYGYPSAATKTWLNNLAASGQNESVPVPTPDTTPPTISITLPTAGSSLAGTISLTASASDNVGITKVGFYINNNLIIEDMTAPYETAINTETYADGNYTLTAVAYDSMQYADTSVSVIFNNNQVDTENPVTTIFNPTDNPHVWTSGELILEARATDNKSVVKMEFYAGTQLLATQNDDYIGIRLAWFDGHPGDYIFKAKAYDAAGNVSEATITISKQ